MFPLIKKELREHAPVAALGLAVGLLLTVYHAARGARFVRDGGTSWADSSLTPPIARGNYQGSLIVICGAIAFALGFFLAWKEEWKGTWAFLLHRPVTRGQVLLSKLSAGAILYTGATMLPYGLTALWSALPGNYPTPWSAHYLLGGVAIWLSGLVVLVAALLAGLRPARWYATRFAPVTAALSLLFAGVFGMTWMSLYLAALLGLAMLGLACRQQVTGSSRLRPLAVVVLALGLGGPLFFGVVLVAEEVNEIARAGGGGPPPEPWTQYVFGADGTPGALVQKQAAGFTLSNLDGVEMERDLTSQQTDSRISALVYLGDTPSGPHATLGRWDDSPVQYLPRRDDRGPTRLFALRTEGVICAMDLRTGRPSGFWGSNGFAPERGAVVPFSGLQGSRLGEQEGGLVVVDDAGAHRLDLARGTARRIHDGAVLSVAPSRSAVFVRTASEVTVTSTAAETPGAADQVVRYPLPETLARESFLAVTALPDGTLGIVVDRTTAVAGKAQRRVRMLKLRRDDGAIVWERTVDAPARGVPVEVSPTETAELLGMSAISPLGLVAIALHPKASAPRFAAILGAPWQLGILAAVWLGAALMTQVILRRAELTPARRLGYGALALVLGVPGLLALWAELDEARIPCPACKAMRLPTSVRCRGCGAGWPGAEARDIDIRSSAGARLTEAAELEPALVPTLE